MIASRMLSFLLTGVVLAGCSTAAPPNSAVVPPDQTNSPNTAAVPCKDDANPTSHRGRLMDAVFVQRGELFGVDLKSSTVKQLISQQGSTDFQNESAMFTRSGNSLLVHRDKEGRDSWWAIASDGSELQRLQLPVDGQIRQAVALCREEFVGVLKDGRFLRFSLHGEKAFWKPEETDAPLPDVDAVASARGNLLAYVSRSGVVVLVPHDTGLAVAWRVQGKEIHGWVGDKVLVTGDAEALYVLDLSDGQSHRVEYKSILSKGPRITSVSVHPDGDLVYVVDRSSIPQASRDIVGLVPTTLRVLTPLPHQPPTHSGGAPRFSPLGGYEAWPVDEPKDVPYASPVAIVKVATGDVVHVTDSGMVSVPYVFHPGDNGFVFTDLSRGGTDLVYEDGSGHRTDLRRSAAGSPFKAFQWNPQLAARPGK